MTDIPDRPEWVSCIINRGSLATETWCKRAPGKFEWTFESIEHALAAARVGSRMQACPECVREIVSDVGAAGWLVSYRPVSETHSQVTGTG